MRIVAVNERTIPLSAASRNASISFDAMTASAIAIVTDASDGRQAADRAWPSTRSDATDTALCCANASSRACSRPIRDDYADGDGGIDPDKVWAVADAQRKAGRSWRAVGRGRADRCRRSSILQPSARACRYGPICAERYQRAGCERHRYLCQRRPLSRRTTTSATCATTSTRRLRAGIAASRSRSAASLWPTIFGASRRCCRCSSPA